MPSTKKTGARTEKAGARAATAAAVKSKSKPVAAKSGETMSLQDVMRTLEKSGSEQAKKTYARHGATEPMFGVSFGTLGALQKRIRQDHGLALKLWGTGNVDARNLAMKIADPAVIKPSELDRWARENPMRMCGLCIGSLAQESGHGATKAKEWLGSANDKLRAAGWTLIGVLANRDEQSTDEVFARHLTQIEASIQAASSEVKYAMNGALIAIGGRSAGLRKAATAAAKRIGKLDVDLGDTACQTPDAVTYIEKVWQRLGKKFASPAAAERARESMRTRC